MPTKHSDHPSPADPTGDSGDTDDKTRIMPADDGAAPAGTDPTRRMPPADDATRVQLGEGDDRTMVASDVTQVIVPVAGEKTASDATVLQSGETVMVSVSELDAIRQQSSGEPTHLKASSELLDVKAIRARGETVIKDRFVLKQLLGVGGMGSVYKAQDLRKVEARDRDPWVAVKLLNEDFREHPDAFVSLQREARKSQTLAHPNIVQVFDFDRDGDSVFMTMELLQGHPFTEYIENHPGGIPLDDVMRYTREMGAALSHAHANRIIHADFKPGNVFLTGKDRVKVLDFGIARAVTHAETDISEDDKTIFDPGSLGALTPAYASLEMLAGMEPEARDDLYALGCIAYQLLTGKHPYNKMPAHEVKNKGLVPVRPAKLPLRKWRALKRAIALHREDRFDSVDDFLDRFAPVAHPWAWGFAATAAIAVVIGGIGVWQGLDSKLGEEARKAEIQAREAQLSARSRALEAAKGVQAQLDGNFRSLQARVEEMKNALDQRRFAFDGSEAWQQQTDRQQASLAAIYSTEPWQPLLQTQAITDPAIVDTMREAEQARRDKAAVNLQSWLDNYQHQVADSYLEFARREYEQERFVSARSSISQAEALYAQAPRLRDTRQGLEDAEAAYRAANAALAREAAEAERARRLAALELELVSADEAISADLGKCANTLDRTGRGGTFSYDIPALAALLQSQRQRFGADFPERVASLQQGYVDRLGECIQLYGFSDPAAARTVLAQAGQAFPAHAARLATLPITPWNNCKDSFAGRGERYTCQDRLFGSDLKGPVLVMVPGAQAAGAYAIGKYEITVGEFNQYCESTGACSPSGADPLLPVTGRPVSELEGYLNWLSESTGFHYQLPDIEQWRRAATSEQAELDTGRNCYLDSRGIVKGRVLLPADTGRSNAWGLVNYVGNARELVRDAGGVRAVGGSRLDPMDDCTLATVADAGPEGDEVTGLRVVRTLQ
ncbi:bifunctional serine/threonine-protein kinase/formylglycine-generating enzyme family protein [Parahaliea mediterranea]|uniref:bifunctional serine/threonine-protein kinase/formylglycine-generating enzyme family protein n=1 Tax=Parahaliea mediterranea TaxID=651086 RepID=UPI001300ACF1|nr:bifunctional serine/threonine-protein kinase/formylglycine-generating enzyme family protein [Parahaliea mediterranea]